MLQDNEGVVFDVLRIKESYPGFFERMPNPGQETIFEQEVGQDPPYRPQEHYLNSTSQGLTGAPMSGHSNSSSSSNSNQQHYCLRWNNHQHNLLGVLESVLASQQHADVSLFCEGHVLRVHKLVLLASSSHFERILEASPAGQQPVIILDGTRFADLRALVDYMYRGEVNIEQDQLTSLLRTAETLKIKGLADVGNKEEDDRGGGNGEGGGGANGEGLNPIATSPPSKRPKASPSDNCSSARDTKESIRDLRDMVQVEPRDFSREGPRDLTRELSSHFSLTSSGGSSPYVSHRRAMSPVHSFTTSNSMASARSLLYSSALISRQSSKSPVSNLSSAPYFTGALVRSRSPPHSQFDPSLGSSLHPPKTSPQSPANEHNKIVPQIPMPPFGLPFSLPMLHESKKILDRTSSKLLPSPYELPPRGEDRDIPSNWPSRGSDLDIDRERELRERERDHEREWERDGDREKGSELLSERLSMQHHTQPPVHQTQEPLAQPLILRQQLQQKKVQEPPHASPLHLHAKQPTNNLSRIELLEKEVHESERRNEDDKFSSSPEKDTSFSPPDDTHSVSSKTDYTPEGDTVEDEEDSSNGGSIRDGMIPTGNGEITSTITSTTNTNGRPPSGSSTASTPATSQGDSVKCPYCPRSYRHQNNLRTHIRCFHKGVRIPCPICRRGFTRWFTVRCHIAREHQNYDFNQPERLPAQLRRALYPPFAE